MWSQLCLVTPEPSEHLVDVILQESNGTSGSHWILLPLRTFGGHLPLCEVRDKCLVVLWGFWVKGFGSQWLIVLGVWWEICTSLLFRACSLNKGYFIPKLSQFPDSSWADLSFLIPLATAQQYPGTWISPTILQLLVLGPLNVEHGWKSTWYIGEQFPLTIFIWLLFKW